MDVDGHHYENECFDEFLPLVENPGFGGSVGLCGPGAGCVITGADPMSGDGCAHPVREGGPPPPYKNHQRIQAVYRAACTRLKINPAEWR